MQKDEHICCGDEGCSCHDGTAIERVETFDDVRYADWHGGPGNDALDFDAAVDRILAAQGD